VDGAGREALLVQLLVRLLVRRVRHGCHGSRRAGRPRKPSVTTRAEQAPTGQS
jgi:hypothetical protein